MHTAGAASRAVLSYNSSSLWGSVLADRPSLSDRTACRPLAWSVGLEAALQQFGVGVRHGSGIVVLTAWVTPRCSLFAHLPLHDASPDLDALLVKVFRMLQAVVQ